MINKKPRAILPPNKVFKSKKDYNRMNSKVYVDESEDISDDTTEFYKLTTIERSMEFDWKAFQDVNSPEVVYQAKLNRSQYLFKTLKDDKWIYWSDNRSLEDYEKFYIEVGKEDVKES